MLALEKPLLPGVTISQHPDCIHVAYDWARPTLSSAVLGGGYCMADHILNLRVSGDEQSTPNAGIHWDDPATTLQAHCDGLGLSGVSVGMMTAAAMASLRVVEESVEGHQIAVAVTSGLQNARRAGDRAEVRDLYADPGRIGTINLVVVTSLPLAPEAMVEMVMLVTEAKAAALQTLSVLSPVSGELATGTGTDAVVISGGASDTRPVRYTGKHTLLGERLAVLVMRALRSSVTRSEEGRLCA